MEPQKAKYSEQMKAWALDRAIEAHKLDKDSKPTPADVIATADVFVSWVSNPAEDLDNPEIGEPVNEVAA